MKRNFRHRVLAYEQLESKDAPTSILMVVPGDSTDSGSYVVAGAITTHALRGADGRYETDQILRFVAENTFDEHAHQRAGTLPTVAQCAVADEMMKLAPIEWNSILVLGFYDDGTGL